MNQMKEKWCILWIHFNKCLCVLSPYLSRFPHCCVLQNLTLYQSHNGGRKPWWNGRERNTILEPVKIKYEECLDGNMIERLNVWIKTRLKDRSVRQDYILYNFFFTYFIEFVYQGWNCRMISWKWLCRRKKSPLSKNLWNQMVPNWSLKGTTIPIKVKS